MQGSQAVSSSLRSITVLEGSCPGFPSWSPLSLPPSHFVLSERSLLFSKFPEFFCYFCFWSHFVIMGLPPPFRSSRSPSFSPSLSFSWILASFSVSLCLLLSAHLLSLSPSFAPPTLECSGVAGRWVGTEACCLGWVCSAGPQEACGPVRSWHG